jgi:hypothetical protein
MRSLAELQAAITAAIFKGDVSPLADEITAGRADARRRFDIFRNNTFLSLTNHLKAVFPTTAKLGDARFFAYVAQEYIRAEPPHEPRLSAYGAGFARFLARFPACRGTPILAEMAALEWAVHSALISEEKPALPPQALSDIEPGNEEVCLKLQPSLNFSLSRWPLLSVWAGEADGSSPLPRSLTRLGVYRHGERIRFATLLPARFALWRALEREQSLDVAALRALAREPHVDLASEILNLFSAGLVTEVMVRSLR